VTHLQRHDPDGVAPPAAGGYTHVVGVDLGDRRMLFVSGQLPLDRDGSLVGAGDMAAQTHQVFENIRIILEHATVPVIVDAGVGTASDAAIAMEMGCDGVLMNTAIASAKDPILMAEAMRLGVEAGRKAFLAGRIPKKLYATASSPLDGILA